MSVADYPHTISYVIRRRMQIDSYFELPEEKRPPRDIWDKPSELEEWFDRAFSEGKKQTEFNIPVKDNEIEV
jgi:hypothetical protein